MKTHHVLKNLWSVETNTNKRRSSQEMLCFTVKEVTDFKTKLFAEFLCFVIFLSPGCQCRHWGLLLAGSWCATAPQTHPAIPTRHEPINYKDTKTKYRLYLCLVEFIDWSHVEIFDPAVWTIAPLTFLSGSPPPPLLPFPKSKYNMGGGGGVVFFWRPNSAEF